MFDLRVAAGVGLGPTRGAWAHREGRGVVTVTKASGRLAANSQGTRFGNHRLGGLQISHRCPGRTATPELPNPPHPGRVTRQVSLRASSAETGVGIIVSFQHRPNSGHRPEHRLLNGHRSFQRSTRAPRAS
ncbi:hypothetical protein BaRGS_00004518 [Batillaria attramentaria]|uniref:Uncharacterized protein n=1 Tax=Batillaria attramentaria TaxID=370345 RepID=A0ABD0LX54_9CAEN